MRNEKNNYIDELQKNLKNRREEWIKKKKNMKENWMR